MTTFTSDDREEEYKKIVEAAPFQPGYEDAVPIPFAGWVNASPPHIVDSGASVMEMNANQLADFVEISKPNDKAHQMIATMLRQQQAEISLLQEYVCQLESGLDSSIKLNKAQAERQEKWFAYDKSASLCGLALTSTRCLTKEVLDLFYG